MSEDVIEAGRFGATERQILFKIQLPLAKSTILAGINQVLLALSMVVILQWLEQRTWKHSVSRNSTERHCKGFESGLGIVILL
jgi:glycine betaine/proline transport system permease protein